MHKKTNLPKRICVTCKRPFNWRRKWRDCWDQVRYCSERCRRNKVKKPQDTRPRQAGHFARS